VLAKAACLLTKALTTEPDTLLGDWAKVSLKLPTNP
jgi:hypothetical protein